MDHGTSVGAPSEDYDGKPRPKGSGYDIGAYEYQYPVGVPEIDRKSGVPESMILFQNYPNPFNATTVISYSLPVVGFVELAIYNLAGQRIRTLLNENQSTGIYQADWDARNDVGQHVGSGLYFCTLKGENFVRIRKLLLLK